jgi:hypothetical protein
MVAHAQAAAARDTAERPQSPVALWRHIFGEGHGFLCLFSGRRPAPGDKRLLEVAETYWPYPQSLAFAEQEAYQQDALGREVYFCAHLLTRKRRRKEAAAPVWSLWVDGDGARPHDLTPLPSAEIVSSPGRRQFFWRLAEPIDPGRAEALNRRIAYGIGADRSGWDLTQLVRVPGCHNRKYPDAPEVTIGALDETWVWPADDIDGMAPPLPVALAAIEPPPPPEADDIDDTEPPVRLGADGLAWWRGERVARKEDGGVDRSETLWGIACELWDAGASRGTLLAALAERDRALGHECFTVRPEEYARIARKLAERENGGMTGKPHLAGTAGACPGCAERDATIAQLRAWNRANTAALQNKELKKEARGAIGIAKVWQAHREQRDSFVDPETEQRFVHVPLEEAGREVGYSDDTAADAVDKLDAYGLLVKKRKYLSVKVKDPRTGEEREQMIRRVYVHIPDATPADFLQRVAAFDPQKPPEERHGGYRPKRCEEHPDAPLKVTTLRVAACGVCGAETERTETRVDLYSAGGEPINLADFRARVSKPHLAGSYYRDGTEEDPGANVGEPVHDGCG